MIYKLLIILSFFIFLTSCAPKPFILSTDYPKLDFERTEQYDIQNELNKIPKPSKLQTIYVQIDIDNNIKIVKTADKATHILLAPKEYSKVGALVKLAKTYKKIVIEQEFLVNTYINTINGLKELLELERLKVKVYRELYVNSENAYRQELHQHKVDNFINRSCMYLITTGSIALLLFAL